jgi:hypothetical protein
MSRTELDISQVNGLTTDLANIEIEIANIGNGASGYSGYSGAIPYRWPTGATLVASAPLVSMLTASPGS